MCHINMSNGNYSHRFFLFLQPCGVSFPVSWYCLCYSMLVWLTHILSSHEGWQIDSLCHKLSVSNCSHVRGGRTDSVLWMGYQTPLLVLLIIPKSVKVLLSAYHSEWLSCFTVYLSDNLALFQYLTSSPEDKYKQSGLEVMEVMEHLYYKHVEKLGKIRK